MFKLNKILEKDTFFIKDLQLCKVLLINNSHYPWFILVPRRPEMKEVFELDGVDQFQLSREMNEVAKIVKHHFKADKINIAAFGNVVSQLHVHIIARYKDDRVFPDPVWLDKEKLAYDDEKSGAIIKDLNSLLT